MIRNTSCYDSPVFTAIKIMKKEEYEDEDSNKNINLFLDFPLLEIPLKHFQFGNNFQKWALLTIWNQNLLEEVHPWLRMVPGEIYDASLRNLENLIQDGHQRVSRDHFKFEENSILVRIVRPVEEPYRLISETICLPVMEYCFMEARNEVTVISSPLQLIACSGLADILRAIYKQSDLLMIRGSFRKLYFHEENKRYLLTNVDCSERSLQVIRLTFNDDARTELIESITPKSQEGRFKFKYYAAESVVGSSSTRRRIAVWHQDFQWNNSSRNDIFEKKSGDTGSLAEFQAPIPCDVDAYIPYIRLMEKVPLRNLRSIRLFTFTRTNSFQEEEDLKPTSCPSKPRSDKSNNVSTKTSPKSSTLHKLLVFVFLLLAFCWTGFITLINSNHGVPFPNFYECISPKPALDYKNSYNPLSEGEKAESGTWKELSAMITTFMVSMKVLLSRCLDMRNVY